MYNTQNFFRASAEDFKKIPGSPVAYWAGEALFNDFVEFQTAGNLFDVRNGITTSDNNIFLRLWHEISQGGVRHRWFPCNKGGKFRKWYGNCEYLLDWEDDGRRLKSFVDDKGRPRPTLRGIEKNFTEGVTMSRVTSDSPSFRVMSNDSISESATNAIYEIGGRTEKSTALLLLLNSYVGKYVLSLVNPTINVVPDDIRSFPVRLDIPNQSYDAAAMMVEIAHMDWDSYETSWDFSVNPLIAAWNLEREKAGESSGEVASRDLPRDGTLQGIYKKVRAGWAANCEEMRRLETENNRIFIEAYGLQDELTPEVPWHEITLTCNPLYRYAVKNDELGIKNEELEKGRLPQVAKLEERLKADTVKELVSYAVGCMMGRYAIDKPGLVLANQGATYEDYLAQISEPAFAPDDDGIIPILEDDCFADDIVTQFHRFLRITFGERNFNANLSFIEDALGKDLRSYFVKDFYADHLQRYQKRPIYWLFSSPKGTFSALIYLHRYHPGTVGQVLGYLRSHITKIQSRVDAADRTAADPAATQGMKTRAIKERAKLVRQLKELEDYERDVLHPLAGQRIEIDLDDGVKANYPKFGKALRKIPGLE